MLISQCESNNLCPYLHNEINLAEVYTGLKKYASVTNTSEIMWDVSVSQKGFKHVSVQKYFSCCSRIDLLY